MAKLLETLSGWQAEGRAHLSWLCPLEKLECFLQVRAVASHHQLLWASLVCLLPSSCSYRPFRGLNCPSKE